MQIFTIFIKTLARLQRSVSLYLLVVCCYVHTMEADKNAEPGWLRATAHLEHREIVHRYAWVLSTKNDKPLISITENFNFYLKVNSLVCSWFKK